jgi:hypothetical protein
MIVARIVRCFTTTAATLIVALCSMLRAQELEPRAYSNSPTGLNFAIVGYGYAKASVLTDPSLPLDNVSNVRFENFLSGSLTPWQLLDQFARIQMVEVWFKLRAGGCICLERITPPEAAQAALIHQLNNLRPLNGVYREKIFRTAKKCESQAKGTSRRIAPSIPCA